MAELEGSPPARGTVVLILKQRTVVRPLPVAHGAQKPDYIGDRQFRVCPTARPGEYPVAAR